jgi:hypothetical protein
LGVVAQGMLLPFRIEYVVLAWVEQEDNRMIRQRLEIEEIEDVLLMEMV